MHQVLEADLHWGRGGDAVDEAMDLIDLIRGVRLQQDMYSD